MLLVDLDKCLGCCACEVGCQQWHNAPARKKRVLVRTIGPQKVGDQLVAEHYPEMTAYCDLCASIPSRFPFCVEICPVKALRSCDDREAAALLKSGKRFQVCKR
jgi:Fe-S-cluster-containing dehydrogenase component